MKMLTQFQNHKRFQLAAGFLIGVVFGFLLQKGGVTKYDTIIGQLLFRDFTVVKIMLSAMITGMIGIHLLKITGMVRLHPKPGSFGSTVVGGLLFGVGFAVLGYCPGTVVGAAAQGSLDALVGGIAGIIIGSGLFASLYPRLEKKFLGKGSFGEITFPELFKTNEWNVIIPVAIIVCMLLVFIEKTGL
jgi:uncharacterized protein